MIDDFTMGHTKPVTAYISSTYIALTNSWTGNTTYSWNEQAHYYFQPAKPHQLEIRDRDADMILKRHGRALNEAEKAFVRRFNFQPTERGIRTCSKRHNRVLQLSVTAPGLEARFDRRIPRWRSTRWKALT